MASIREEKDEIPFDEENFVKTLHQKIHFFVTKTSHKKINSFTKLSKDNFEELEQGFLCEGYIDENAELDLIKFNKQETNKWFVVRYDVEDVEELYKCLIRPTQGDMPAMNILPGNIYDF